MSDENSKHSMSFFKILFNEKYLDNLMSELVVIFYKNYQRKWM